MAGDKLFQLHTEPFDGALTQLRKAESALQSANRLISTVIEEELGHSSPTKRARRLFAVKCEITDIIEEVREQIRACGRH